MKVRIGVGSGAGFSGPADLAAIVDGITAHHLDSLWLSEVLSSPVPDPLVGLAFAAAHDARVKLGTTMLLPGRNLLRLAKALATLDALSSGRLLVTFVPGLVAGRERFAVGVVPARRRGAIAELLPILRRLLSGETVNHVGEHVELHDARIEVRPVQQPLEFWLGGMAPASLALCGRLGDGWLPASCTPAEVAAGRRIVEEAAAAAGRTISPEHFGVSIGYARAPLAPEVAAAVAARGRGNPPEALVPVGLGALRRQIEEFIAVGFSKFVVRPIGPAPSWPEELADLAAALGDLQT